MKVIFLDIDGVLVSRRSILKFRDGRVFGPWHIAQLNRVIEKTGAKIVVSSVWRYDGLEKIREKLKIGGVQAEVVDITPRFNFDRARGLEIQAWLDAWKKAWHKPEDKVEQFIIIDDDSDMHHLMPYLVHTSFIYGLTKEKANEVIRRLEAKDERQGRGRKMEQRKSRRRSRHVLDGNSGR